MKNSYMILLLILTSCGDFTDITTIDIDLIPPFLESIKVIDSRTLQINSSEPISLISSSFVSREDYIIEDFVEDTNSLILTFNKDLIAGIEYCSEFRIEDENSNSLSFISNYFGYNDSIPNLMINEFMCRGSKTNPDKVELYILSSGNMAGLTVFNGTKNSYDSFFTFPSINVNQGDYIVIRSISDNYSIPFIETDNLDIEHDKKFLPGIRDLRVEDFSLSTTNGVLSIYSDPYGEPIDAVVFSKNINDDSKNYRNFGLSKVITRIDEISEQGLWDGITDIIFPEDAVFVGNSTTTRTLNRQNFLDSNTNEEWYTVDTGEDSFGYVNSTIVY
ncbi:MAG: hypothetical protein OCD02_02435 [Spirochaetaceae bacterium]